jgi:integrase
LNDPRKTFHSFRHTFKSGLKNAGVKKSMRDDLCGHADNSAGAGYEHGQPIEAMKAALEKLQFDGFVLGVRTPT